MLPKTRAQELRHRKVKREREVDLAIEAIRVVSVPRPEILEFGSGNGFQIPYLEGIGNVTASDVYTSTDIAGMKHVNFVQCSISDTPFADEKFDVIFSNHVIEHVEDLPKAFRELRRIGKTDCVYAFAVPTNVWLTLSIPVAYMMKALKVLGVSPRSSSSRVDQHTTSASSKSQGTKKRFLRRVLPAGHGVVTDFSSCYRMFKISSWQALFSSHGFEIIAVKPLLLYGPSEFPVIPTMKNIGMICSSVLFLMHKKAH